MPSLEGSTESRMRVRDAESLTMIYRFRKAASIDSSIVSRRNLRKEEIIVCAWTIAGTCYTVYSFRDITNQEVAFTVC